MEQYTASKKNTLNLRVLMVKKTLAATTPFFNKIEKHKVKGKSIVTVA